MDCQFGQVPTWIVGAASPGATRLYAWLAGRYADGGGRCWPSQLRLAEDLRCSTASVRRWMAELRRLGAVVSRRWRRADGWWGGTVYTLSNWGPSRNPSSGPQLAGKRSKNQTQSPTEFPSGAAEPHTGDVKYDSVNRNQQGSGTPTQRLVGWWLSHRKQRPDSHHITRIGKAVKTCLDSGVSVNEVRYVLQKAMQDGVDLSPRVVLRGCGIFPKRPDPQPQYTTANPLKLRRYPSAMKTEPLPSPDLYSGWSTPGNAGSTSLPLFLQTGIPQRDPTVLALVQAVTARWQVKP